MDGGWYCGLSRQNPSGPRAVSVHCPNVVKPQFADRCRALSPLLWRKVIPTRIETRRDQALARASIPVAIKTARPWDRINAAFLAASCAVCILMGHPRAFMDS